MHLIAFHRHCIVDATNRVTRRVSIRMQSHKALKSIGNYRPAVIL